MTVAIFRNFVKVEIEVEEIEEDAAEASEEDECTTTSKLPWRR